MKKIRFILAQKGNDEAMIFTDGDFDADASDYFPSGYEVVEDVMVDNVMPSSFPMNTTFVRKDI
jgi:hypothetical protein